MSTIIYAVHVHWSESRYFPEEEKEYSLKEFEELASKAAYFHTDDGSYLKTKVTIWFDEARTDGQLYRIDLNQEETGIRSHFSNMRAYLIHLLNSSATGEKHFYHYQEKLEWLDSIDWETSMEIDLND